MPRVEGCAGAEGEGGGLNAVGAQISQLDTKTSHPKISGVFAVTLLETAPGARATRQLNSVAPDFGLPETSTETVQPAPEDFPKPKKQTTIRNNKN